MKRQTTLFDYQERSKLLIITSCSKKKLNYSAKAKDLYQGNLFKKVNILSKKIGADLMVLSTKYGLINSETIIEPYDQKILYKSDIDRLRKISNPILSNLESIYTKIVIIMGQKYRKVIQPVINNSTKCIIVNSKSGIGGYLKKVNMLIESNNPRKEILEVGS